MARNYEQEYLEQEAAREIREAREAALAKREAEERNAAETDEDLRQHKPS